MGYLSLFLVSWNQNARFPYRKSPVHFEVAFWSIIFIAQRVKRGLRHGVDGQLFWPFLWTSSTDTGTSSLWKTVLMAWGYGLMPANKHKRLMGEGECWPLSPWFLTDTRMFPSPPPSCHSFTGQQFAPNLWDGGHLQPTVTRGKHSPGTTWKACNPTSSSSPSDFGCFQQKRNTVKLHLNTWSQFILRLHKQPIRCLNQCLFTYIYLLGSLLSRIHYLHDTSTQSDCRRCGRIHTCRKAHFELKGQLRSRSS